MSILRAPTWAPADMMDTASRHTATAKRPLGYWLRTARLVSGMVLMTFVVMHLLNHMLALISLEAAEAGRLWFLLVWRNPAGTILFYGALLIHVCLVLLALYRRRTLVMPVREACQVVLGLLIPLLLAEHVIGTRVYRALSGVDDTYEFVANALWIWAPDVGLRQTFAVAAVWVHGCLGLYFWLRHRAWFSTAAATLLILAALIPVLALLGFVNAGRSVEMVAFTGADGIDPAVIDAALAAKSRIETAVYAAYGGAVVLVLGLRLERARRERRNIVEVCYPDGRAVRVPKGYSVLEASRLAGIAHNAVCGGRGRCSTCRIKVLEGGDRLPSPEALEQVTLSRIHAEPDVRLACQLRPMDDVKVVPLLAAGRNVTAPTAGGAAAPGREQDVAILFCDIRSFTALADRKLPFDIVFLLNRYFAVVGAAVERAGGTLDKFIGDGAMAIFGLDASKMEACHQALLAAKTIVDELARVSDDLAAELRQPLRVAMGIHFGPAIVGTMGYGRAMGVTAIGDTVNIASRLETVAKELDAAIIVSSAAAELSGIDFSGYETRTVDIRGRSQPLQVHVVPQGVRLDTRRMALARAPKAKTTA